MAHMWKIINTRRYEESIAQTVTIRQRVSVALGVRKHDDYWKPVRPQFFIEGYIANERRDGSFDGALYFPLSKGDIIKHFPSVEPYFEWDGAYPDELSDERKAEFEAMLETLKVFMPVWTGGH